MWGFRVKLLLVQRCDRHLGQLGRSGWRRRRIHDGWRDDYDQFRVRLVHRPGAKELSQDRQIADTWHLGTLRRRSLIQQSGDAKTLPVSQLHDGLDMASGNGRQRKSADDYCVREIKRAHFWKDLQPDGIVALDVRGKFQFDPEGLELERNRGLPCCAGDNRVGQFSASQETCRLAIGCQQVRLGQDLQYISLLQVTKGCAQVKVRPEDEDVQEIRNALLGGKPPRGRPDYACQLSLGAEAKGPELLRGRRSNGVRASGAEQVEAEGGELRSIHLGKSYFQQHLLLPVRQCDLDGVHNLLG